MNIQLAAVKGFPATSVIAELRSTVYIVNGVSAAAGRNDAGKVAGS